MLMLKDWNYKTLNTDTLNLDEKSTSTRKIIHEGKGSPRFSNPRHAQNGRNEESSRTTQNLREHLETIQKLTSQLQEMQEQINSMNDSGEFQEVESNYSGRLSYVPSQPAMIPSSRSMLSRDKRLPFYNMEFIGITGKRFLAINFLRVIDHEIIIKESTLVHHKENEDQFHKLQGPGLFSQEMTNKVETQFQCRHLQEGRRL